MPGGDEGISAAAIEVELERDGYALVHGCAEGQVAELRAFFEDLDEAPREFLSTARDLELEARRHVDRRVRASLQPLVDVLLPGYEAFIGGFLDKGPESPRAAYHQDLTYTDERFHRAFVVWMPLGDVGTATGALRVVPGSHRWSAGIRPGGPGGRGEIDHLASRLDGLAETLEVPAGSVVIWDLALVHGSLGNQSDERRPVAAVTVAPRSARRVYFHADRDGSVAGFDIDESFLDRPEPFLERPPGVPSVDPWTAPVSQQALESELWKIVATNEVHRAPPDATSEASPASSLLPPDLLAYLTVDQFMRGFLDTVGLDVALRQGLVDYILQGNILERADVDGGLGLLVDVLTGTGVLWLVDGRVDVTPAFRVALAHVDLLHAKVHYTLRLAADLAIDPGPIFAFDPDPTSDHRPRYMDLYSYADAATGASEHDAKTLDWVRYMTVLTKYEAPVALHLHDFARHRRMLDIGGNSGEFVFQACAATPGLEGVVFDLPGVVVIGERMNAERPGRDRVGFVAGDALADPLPEGCDLVTFKGVLHDWPSEDARRLLTRAWEALEPGGELMVFERSDAALADSGTSPMSTLTMTAWAWILSGPDRYVGWLGELGAASIEVLEFDLDMPWFLLVARKGTD